MFFKYSLLIIVIVNRGSKFKKEVTKVFKHLGIDYISISPYNSKVNRVNEVGYIPIILIFIKITNRIGKEIYKLLLYILFIDRTIVYRIID